MGRGKGEKRGISLQKIKAVDSLYPIVTARRAILNHVVLCSVLEPKEFHARHAQYLPLALFLHHIRDSIQQPHHIPSHQPSDFPVPLLFSHPPCLHKTPEEPLRDIDEAGRGETLRPLLVGKSVNAAPPGRPLPIALIPAHQRTRLVAPVEALGKRTDGYVGDLDPAFGLEVAVTSLYQRGPIAYRAHEDPKADQIVGSTTGE